MKKTERHRRDLEGLVDRLMHSDEADPLLDYMLSHSSLPGRRANLELAQAFGDLVQARPSTEGDRLWKLCTGMTEFPPEQAPVNDPKEFLAFCGAIGMGALGARSPTRFEQAGTSLRALSNDPRWRMREAVCFGLQRMLAAQTKDTNEMLVQWIAPGTWLELRAAAAAIAEPTLLKDKELALSALRLHKRILTRVLTCPDRRSEPFRALRKALGYTLSVVVQAIPQEGFAWLAQLADSQDADVLWIVKQNLRKNLLARHFPEQVEEIRSRIAR